MPAKYRWAFVLLGLLLSLWVLAALSGVQASAMSGTCPPPPQSNPPAPKPGAPSGQPAPEQILACVGSQSITGATFEHWANIAGRSNEPAPKHSKPNAAVILKQVMEFLISADWVMGEAKALNIHVSALEVRRTFKRIRREQFPRYHEFEVFLRQSGQTVADLQFRVRLNLTSQRLQTHVLAGHHSARSRQRALQRFVHDFRVTWQAQTYCEPGYAVQNCGHVQASL